MAKKKRKVINNKSVLYAIILLFATIFMSFGYANVNGEFVNIDGSAKVISQNAFNITHVAYESDNSAMVSSSVINDYTATTLNSTITLGNVQTSTITYAVTIHNTTDSNYAYSGTSYSAPNFYDNQNITFTVTGISVGDTIYPDTSKTFYITFSYVGSDISNPVLNSYIAFNFDKYYSITYQNINTTGQNYPTRILDSETSKVITFTGDIPYDVNITPSVSYTYSNGVLTLNNVKNNITINRYYSITYNLDGGSNPNNQVNKYLHGSNVTILDATKTNNVFGGWYDNASFTGNPITNTNGLTGNLVLYAKWIASGYQKATDYIYALTDNASSSSTNIITVNSDNNSCTNTFAYDGTTHNNLRYVGANPCNYVWFNCQSGHTSGATYCEKWRIIGVMNGVDDEPVIKIYKDSNSASSAAWDSGKKNTWTSSSLYNTLNTTYLQSLNTGVDNYILNAKWFIGGVNVSNNTPTVYNSEVSTQSSAAYIGLYSLTDYSYATSGTNDTTRATCINSALNGTSINATCTDNNYLFQSSSYQNWTIDKRYNGNNQAIYVSNAGKGVNGTTSSLYYYKPAVYLKSTVKINSSSSDGSSDNPYELSAN